MSASGGWTPAAWPCASFAWTRGSGPIRCSPGFLTIAEAVTDAEYVEITRSEDYDVLMTHCKRVMSG